MSREREAIEEIWVDLKGIKKQYDEYFTIPEYDHNYGWLEEILTLLESRIQDDLEDMAEGGAAQTASTEDFPIAPI